MPNDTQSAVAKISSRYPAERIAEVEDSPWTSLLRERRTSALAKAASAASASSFARVWENPDDDVYDAL